MLFTINKKIVLYFILLSLVFQTQIFANRSVVQWWTSKGTFKALIREDLVPIVTYRFLTLVDQNYYDNLTFHNIESNDAVYSGQGSTSIDTTRHQFDDSLAFDSAGVIGIGHYGHDTNCPEYFITCAKTTWLNKEYSAFGYVIEGMNVVHAINSVETEVVGDDLNKPVIEVVVDSVRVISQVTGTIDIPEKQFHNQYAQITFDSFIRPNGNVVITFNNPEKNIFTLNVINAQGKLVKVFTNISDNRFEIEKSLLAEGVYFIELKGPKIYRGKVLIRN